MSWLAFTMLRSARPPKFDSKPQMRWFGGQHRVVVRRRVLVVDVVAVHGDRVARASSCAPPSRCAARRPDASLPITWYGWSWRLPHTLSLPSRLRNSNVGQRLEDRRPHRVEVDRGRHHRDERLVGRELRQRELVDVDGLARVLVLRRQPVEHLLVSRPRTDGAAERQRAELVAGRALVAAVAQSQSTSRRPDVQRPRRTRRPPGKVARSAWTRDTPGSLQ